MNDTRKNKSYPKRNDSSSSTRSRIPQPGKPGLESRQAAAKILAAVIDRKTPLDGMLDGENGNPAYRALSDADRALVRAILNTALRYLPRIEAVLASLVQTPLPEGARALHHVLVVAATQILHLDVPDHSAVDLAVEQAQTDPRSRRFASLVNAVLRRLTREKAEHLAATAVLPVLPGWFHDRLSDVYGREHAQSISEAQCEPPAIDLTVKSDVQGWAERLGGWVLPTGSVRLAAFSGAVSALEGFEAGEWWVQDAAASIPARLFGDLRGRKVADLCAAPGGKSAQLALAGAEVTALDQSASRLRRLKANMDRLGFAVSTRESNLLDFRSEEAFDAVLLDAPCSSTGTIRRHPDVLWTKGPEDIAKLAALQEKLLRHAVDLVEPGGRIVFSNCSLDPAEGEAVVARVLADRRDLVPESIDPAGWPGLEAAISPDGAFRATPAMLPGDGARPGGLDGFYAAVLRRI